MILKKRNKQNLRKLRTSLQLKFEKRTIKMSKAKLRSRW